MFEAKAAMRYVGSSRGLAILAAVLAAAGAGTAGAQSCGETPGAAALVRGLSYQTAPAGGAGEAAVFANPRSELGVFDTAGQPLPGWSLSVDGQPVASMPTVLAAGSYELVATPGPGCAAYEPVRARLTIDDGLPELSWRVADIESMASELPDLGRKKRFLWWWVQPEKRRLVWSDGPTAWAPLRQKVGVEVAAPEGGTRLYVWAPDESPFAARGEAGGQAELSNERVLVIEASDAVSGVGGLRLRLVEKISKASTADEDAEFMIIAEVTDRVGNHVEIELPYVAEQAKGPRKGPF